MNDPTAIAADLPNFRHAIATGQPYKPLYVKIKIVWQCNLRCGMCNHWRETVAPPLDLDFFQRLVDDLAALGCRKIHLTGGEPLLRPNLEDLIAHITARGIRATMTSNATLITAERGHALVAAGLQKINISIDSPIPAIHDRIRGIPGAWQRAIAGFRHLRPWLKPGKMRINTVIGQLNYASLKTLPDLAQHLGADALNLIALDAHTPDLKHLNRWQIAHYNWRIAPVLARQAIAAHLLPHADAAYPFGRGAIGNAHSQQGHYAQGYYDHHRCYAPWTHALIDHTGQVSICCMMPNKPVIGNLQHQSFRDIWAGETYTAIRRTTHRPQFPYCRQCDMFLTENQQIETLLQQPDPQEAL